MILKQRTQYLLKEYALDNLSGKTDLIRLTNALIDELTKKKKLQVEKILETYSR